MTASRIRSASPGRDIPRRRALQRRGGLLQLRPLVQLHGLVPEPERVVLLADGVRRLREDRSRRAARRRTASTQAARRPTNRRWCSTLTKLFDVRPPQRSRCPRSRSPAPRRCRNSAPTKAPVDADGIFHPTGTYGTEHPIGRPVQVRLLDARGQARLVRNEDYWGDKAKLDRSSSGRSPTTLRASRPYSPARSRATTSSSRRTSRPFEERPALQILDRPAFNVGYVGFNLAMPPMDKIEVRQAIAYGLDRTGGGRQLLCGPRRGGEGVHATRAQRVRG